jgi:hypothetical protein
VTILSGFEFSQDLWRPAVFGNPHQAGALHKGSDQEAISVPRGAAIERSIAERERRPAFRGHLLQFPVRAKSDPFAVRREEDLFYTLCSGQSDRLTLVEPPGTDPLFSPRPRAGEGYPHSVRRNRYRMLSTVIREPRIASQINIHSDQGLGRRTIGTQKQDRNRQSGEACHRSELPGRRRWGRRNGRGAVFLKKDPNIADILPAMTHVFLQAPPEHGP